MKPKTFTYTLPADIKANEFPYIEKPRRAKIRLRYDEEAQSVWVEGNSLGLLYLAKCIAAMGLHKGCEDFHIHLWPPAPRIAGMVDKGSLEVSLVNLDDPRSCE